MNSPCPRRNNTVAPATERARAVSILCTILLLCAAAPQRGLADGAWTGTGANASWSTVGNWSGNALPGSPTFGTATFNATVGNNGSTITLGNNGIVILTFAAGAAPFTFNSGTLSFGGAGAAINMNGANASNETFGSSSVVAVGLTTGGNLTATFNNANAAGGGQLILNGTLTGVNGETGTSTVLLEGAGGGQINGNIVNGVAGEVMAVNIASGSWVFSGSNTYTGTTSLTGGAPTLQLAGTNALTDSALLMAGGGASTLQLRSDTNGSTFNTAGITILDQSTIDVNRATGAGVVSGTLNLAGAVGFNTSGTLNVTSANGYTLNIGAVNLLAAGNFNPTTGSLNIASVSGGALALNLLGNGSSNSITGAITTTGAVTVNGTDMWTLNSANSTYSGSTGLTSGTLALGASSVNSGTGVIGSGSLVFGAGTLIAVGGSQTISNILASEGDGLIATIGGSNPLTLSGNYTYLKSNGGFNVNNTALTTLSGSLNLQGGGGAFYFEGSGNLAYTGNIFSTGGGSQLVYQGTGTFDLSGSNSYVSSSTFANGTTVLDASTNTHASLGLTAVNVASGVALTGSTGNATLLVKGNYLIGNAAGTQPSLVIKGGGGSSGNGQGTLSLVDGTINTLTITNSSTGSTTLTIGGAAGSSSILDFEIGNGAPDLITTNGKMTLNAGGASVSIFQLSSTTLTPGIYNLITFSADTLTGSFSLSTPTVGGDGLSLITTGTSLELKVKLLDSSQLAITPSPTILLGNVLVSGTPGSTTATLTNIATGTHGAADYIVNSTGAVSATPAASTGNGGTGPTLAVGASQTLTIIGSGTVAAISGSAVVVGTVGATNTSNPGAGDAAPVNVVVNIYDAAKPVLNAAGTALTNNAAGSNGANSLIASAQVQNSFDPNFTQDTEAWAALTPTIAPGNTATILTFNPNATTTGTELLNGTYSGVADITVSSVTSTGGAIAGPTTSFTSTQSGTVTGQTSNSPTNIYDANILGGGSYVGYGLGSSVAGTLHISTGGGGKTQASLAYGTAGGTAFVNMSFGSATASGSPDFTHRASDILTLTGIYQQSFDPRDNGVLTDMYVLQLSYDTSAAGVAYIVQNTGPAGVPLALTGGMTTGGGQGWINAVAFNSNTAGSSYNPNSDGVFVDDGGAAAKKESFATYLSNNGGTPTLGDYGYFQGVAWAVLDHTTTYGQDEEGDGGVSEFAVYAVPVPEPGDYAMILGGFGMLIGFRRLRKRSSRR